MAISAKTAKDSDRKQSFERLELVPKVAIPQCGNARFFATLPLLTQDFTLNQFW